ncbi:AI-2E family transporter [Xanthomonas translucens]|uniref:AI-2E family transporter n=2 Tax=Xanthomonas campestris pv. translucens TaxID=343 RepID=UPI001F3446C8|nr:AI-2E family transporter [Xanthomonas translucens]UJB15414.1 AI-2E family transporter [Xanthomonas translucens pv. undulosa]
MLGKQRAFRATHVLDVADEALSASGQVWRAWLGGQFLAMLVIGSLTGLGLWLLGVPVALGIGLLTALLDFIPIVGPIVAAVPAVLLGFTVSPQVALGALLVFVVLQQLEGHVLQPLIQARAVDLPPALLLFSLFGIGVLFGPMGVVLAAPLTVVLYVLVCPPRPGRCRRCGAGGVARRGCRRGVPPTAPDRTEPARGRPVASTPAMCNGRSRVESVLLSMMPLRSGTPCGCSPMHHASVRYDRPLIRRAVASFCWRVVGLRYVVALALVAASLVFLVRGGNASWLVGVLASVLALGIAFPVALYATHYRNALRRLDAMGAPVGALEASASSLSLSSAAGTTTLPWSAVCDVWRFESCWLLLLSKSQFVTLPLADLSAEAAEFIRTQVLAAGGKVS